MAGVSQCGRCVTRSCGGTLGLSDPSGSCLRVMSHDVMSVVGMDIYSGLDLGGGSLDMAQHSAGM